MNPGLSTSCKAAARAPRPEPALVEVQTADLEEFTSADLHWQTEYCQAEPGVLCASLRLAQGHSTQVGETRFSAGMQVRGGVPAGTVAFGVLSAREQRFDGRPLMSDQIVLAREADAIEYCSRGPSRLFTVAVDEALLARTVEARWGAQVETLYESRVLTLDEGRGLGALQRGLRSFLAAPAVGSRWLLPQDERVVDLLLHHLRPPAGRREPLPYRQELARAAEEYLRSRSSEPLSMTALCEATGARQRTLYLGFRERYGMSPQSYLRMLRLDSARRSLARARPGTRVTEVALRVGFTHLGRFSREYRSHFGEPPSATLAGSLAHARR